MYATRPLKTLMSWEELGMQVFSDVRAHYTQIEIG